MTSEDAYSLFSAVQAAVQTIIRRLIAETLQYLQHHWQSISINIEPTHALPAFPEYRGKWYFLRFPSIPHGTWPMKPNSRLTVFWLCCLYCWKIFSNGVAKVNLNLLHGSIHFRVFPNHFLTNPSIILSQKQSNHISPWIKFFPLAFRKCWLGGQTQNFSFC